MKVNRMVTVKNALILVGILVTSSLLMITNVAVSKPVTVSPKSERITLSQGIRYPNGITHDKNGALYIGSVVSGNILKKMENGKQEIIFKETDDVFAGTSLRYDPLTDILWVASPDFLGVTDEEGNVTRRPHRIAAIDLSSRQLIKIWLIPDGGFGNDIALDATGGIYVTDSIKDRVYHLSSKSSEFRVLLESKLFTPGRLGPAGIAVLPNDDLIIGLYSDGGLVQVTQSKNGSSPEIHRLKLKRPLENPDGLHSLPDGRLLVLEGASKSGDGRLSLIDLNTQPPYSVKTLVNDIESPLNLTLKGNKLFITESRLRHILLNDAKMAVPQEFFLRKIDINSKVYEGIYVE
ncbi:gluconolaconase [Colwellia sp. Bg11-28]|uniref:gluconolaconase n=1 Tax=Colwellia sp. Bg11-28 TaxID=2058305 RepID=UPI000C34E05C|nr:gluconolaconase [Colwellia sp. Bg11-28]PKH88374.1 gluconolaconase [Colwellia sp. Bg11-28]